MSATTLAAQAPAPASATAPFSVRADLSSAERLDAWTLDGSGVWAIRDGLPLLEKAGVPAGPIRRPGALAILKTPGLGDSSIDVELRSDAPEDVIRRDLLLVAGWQSPDLPPRSTRQVDATGQDAKRSARRPVFRYTTRLR